MDGRMDELVGVVRGRLLELWKFECKGWTPYCSRY